MDIPSLVAPFTPLSHQILRNSTALLCCLTLLLADIRSFLVLLNSWYALRDWSGLGLSAVVDFVG